MIGRPLQRGLVLPSYRLYRLDGAGKIITADWLDADDDEDALRQARAQAAAGAYELWDRDRLLARFGESSPG